MKHVLILIINLDVTSAIVTYTTDLIANTIYEWFKEPEMIQEVIPYISEEKITIIRFPK